MESNQIEQHEEESFDQVNVEETSVKEEEIGVVKQKEIKATGIVGLNGDLAL